MDAPLHGMPLPADSLLDMNIADRPPAVTTTARKRMRWLMGAASQIHLAEAPTSGSCHVAAEGREAALDLSSCPIR
jgi:hypothetical protein